jgi:hypothetical protein
MEIVLRNNFFFQEALLLNECQIRKCNVTHKAVFLTVINRFIFIVYQVKKYVMCDMITKATTLNVNPEC